MFQRLQHATISDDVALFDRVLVHAEASGRLEPGTRTRIQVKAEAPSVHVRDLLKQNQICAIAYERGILSPQTWSTKLNLDYRREQMNIEDHRANHPATERQPPDSRQRMNVASEGLARSSRAAT